MKRLIILISILSLLFLKCENSNKETMATQSTKEKKQDNRSGYASVNGLKMYYEIHGSGFPLVLIHGGGSTIQTTFGRVIDSLARNHLVIAVEMQAHGHTADIDRPLSFEQDADDIAELLKQLKITEADIFGFSNGASTTLQIAIRHPELVNRIVVASTMSKKSGTFPGFWDMMKNTSFEQMPQLLKEGYLKINPDSNALYRMYERDVARMRSFKDIPDDSLRAIKVPAFIIVGEKDVPSPEHAVEMHRLISNSRLVVLPGGHGEYIGEITTPQDPVLINATVSMIEKFLNQQLPKSN